jgi:hypothetical protein
MKCDCLSQRSLEKHGADLSAFFLRATGAARTLFIVETTYGEVFGGYGSDEWQHHATYFGNGDCFLFKVFNANSEPEVIRYPWTHQNTFFQYCTTTTIGFGGG